MEAANGKALRVPLKHKVAKIDNDIKKHRIQENFDNNQKTI